MIRYAKITIQLFGQTITVWNVINLKANRLQTWPDVDSVMANLAAPDE